MMNTSAIHNTFIRDVMEILVSSLFRLTQPILKCLYESG